MPTKQQVARAKQAPQDMETEHPQVTLRDFFSSHKPQIVAILEGNEEAFNRVYALSMAHIQASPALQRCSHASIINGFIKAVAVGLEPGPLNHMYLVPYANQVEFQIGYQGWHELVLDDPDVQHFEAFEHWENDKLAIWRDDQGQHFEHKLSLDDGGEIRGYFSVCWYRDGSTSLLYWSIDRVNAHRDEFVKGWDRKTEGISMWRDTPHEAGKKTVIRQHSKQLRTRSNGLAVAQASDDQLMPEYLPPVVESEILDEDVKHEQQPEEPSAIDGPPSKESLLAQIDECIATRSGEEVRATLASYNGRGALGSADVSTLVDARDALAALRKEKMV